MRLVLDSRALCISSAAFFYMLVRSPLLEVSAGGLVLEAASRRVVFLRFSGFIACLRGGTTFRRIIEML